MKRSLVLAPELELPLEAVTQTFGILAIRRAGKSNAAAVMAEEMHAAKLPFVVIDPKGDWWGLRAPGEGAATGLPIPIFGGEHADVPLEAGGGAFLADLVVTERLSCVLDVSELSEGDKVRFLLEFVERLYRKNRDPLHLFLEEADDYLPQKPFREQARLLGAFQRLVKRGGFRGIGATLITQRSAALNKDVLYMAGTLFILRTIGPRDRQAVAGWIEHQGASAEVLDSLPSLGNGEAWIYSPEFLGLKEPRRLRFRRRATFDSGQTPGASGRRREPKGLADVDLEVVRKQMAAAIERAKAEDPRELRRRIAALEGELRARDRRPVSAAPAPVPVPAPTLKERDYARLLEASARFRAGLEAAAGIPARVIAQLEKATSTAQAVAQRLEAAGGRGPPPGRVPAPVTFRPRVVESRFPVTAAAVDTFRSPRRERAAGGAVEEEGALSGPCRRMMAALAWLEQVGIPVAAKGQLALVSEQRPSGGYRNNLSTLRQAGLIVYPSPGEVALSPEGRGVASPLAPPVTSAQELQAQVLGMVSGPQARILRVLLEAYPNPVEKVELAAMAEQAASGGFRNNLSSLRTLGAIEYPAPGTAVATSWLFLEGRR